MGSQRKMQETRSLEAEMFSEYGAITKRVAAHLMGNSSSTLRQIVDATKLAHKDASMAVALLVHLRYATYACVRNKICYSLEKYEKRLFFGIYADFVSKLATEARHTRVFVKILTRGVMRTKKIRSTECLVFLRANDLLSFGSHKEVKGTVFKRDIDAGTSKYVRSTKNAIRGRPKGAQKDERETPEGAPKKAKVDGEMKRYVYVNYEGIEKRIFDDCFCVYLENRYNVSMAQFFQSILQAKSVSNAILAADMGDALGQANVAKYLEYLVSDKILEKAHTHLLTNEWRDVLKKQVLCAHVEACEGKIARRIFSTLLRREGFLDKLLSRAVLVDNVKMRGCMIGLQMAGYVGVFANFTSNVFYSKTNLMWMAHFRSGINVTRAKMLDEVLAGFVNRARNDDTHTSFDSLSAALDYIVLGFDN